MSKMEYMPVDCLQVPKVLFQMEKYKNLSNTAKILYSLFLDRLKFAVQNGWVDHNGDLFVVYPKSEMKKNLNMTRYGVDQAVQELVQVGKLVRIIPNNGKANHFYINDIYENEMEEESMMTLDRIMANMPLEEREIIMDKMVAASRDILKTIVDERQEAMLRKQIDDLEMAIQSARYEQDGGRYTVKQIEKTRKTLQTRLEKLNQKEKKDQVVTFEELGVDHLYVDEAHSYKNAFLYTKMRNVAGIAQNEAQKSADMFNKCQYLDEITGGKGITFATGTPISNSMTELYVMQRYLQNSKLQNMGLGLFDSWASTFGEVVTSIELAPEGYTLIGR